jgi:hypothetical protein
MATDPPTPPPTPNPTPRPGAAPLAGRGGATPGPTPNPYPGGGPPGTPPGELAESAEHAALGMESAAGAAAGLAAALARVPPPPAPPSLPPPVAPPPALPPATRPSLEAKFAWEERMAAGGWAAAHRQREEEAQAARRAFESLPPPAGPPPTYYPPPPPARDFAGAPAVATRSAAEERAYAQAETEFQRRLAAAQAGPAPPMTAPAGQAPALPTAFDRLGAAAQGAAGSFARLTQASVRAASGMGEMATFGRALVAGGLVGAAVRLASAGNPLVGATFRGSLQYVASRGGGAVGDVVNTWSRALQDVGDMLPDDARKFGRAYSRAYAYSAKLPTWLRGTPLAGLFGGYGALFGEDDRSKSSPLFSYKDLPPVRNLAPEEYAMGFSGAGLEMGPLDTKNWQQEMKNILESLGGKMAEVADNTRGMGGGGFNYGR